MAQIKKSGAPQEPKPKTLPGITREQFARGAKPILVNLVCDGVTCQAIAGVKLDFSSGSLGWYAGDKVTIVIDGVPVKCQLGLNLTVVNSKDLPK